MPVAKREHEIEITNAEFERLDISRSKGTIANGFDTYVQHLDMIEPGLRKEVLLYVVCADRDVKLTRFPEYWRQ